MTVQKEKNGSWSFRCRYTDSQGKAKQKHKSGFSTKRDAKQAEAEFIKQRENGNLETTNGMMLADLTDLYIKSLSSKCQKSTIKTYQIKSQLFLKYVNKKVNKITSNDVRKMCDAMLEDGASKSYIKAIKSLLASVLDFGMQYYGLSKNVAKNVKLVYKREVKKEDEELNYITYEEFKKLDAVLRHDAKDCAIRFMYWTGLRIGELQALKWKDVDRFKTININKSYSSHTDAINPPKTASSERIIILPTNMQEMLKTMYMANSKVDGFNEDCYVFGTNKIINRVTIFYRLRKCVELSGISNVTVHGLRHSHASYLFDIGADVGAISRRLGHSNVMITMQTYIHIMPKVDDKLIELLNKSLV